MQTKVKIFRLISTLEAVSFLILLFIAVPLKYGFDNPYYVEIMGPIHGGLFVLYVIGAFLIKPLLKWTGKTLFITIICSIIPFGPFYVEKRYLPKNIA